MTVKTRAALKTQTASNITNATAAGSITPTIEGALFNDIADSVFIPSTDVSNNGTPANGQLLVGNGTNYTLSTLTAGSNVTITNAAGSITIAATGGGGSGTGTVNPGTANALAYYPTTDPAVSPSLVTVDGSGNIAGVGNITASAFDTTFISGGDKLRIASFAANSGVGLSAYSLLLTANNGNITMNSPTSLVFQRSGSTKITVTSTQNQLQQATTCSSTLAVTGLTTATGGVVSGGRVSAPSTTKTAAYTTTANDYSVFCNGTFTVTLHTPGDGQIMNIKNTGSGTITISGMTDAPSANIAAGVNLQFQYDITGAIWRVL